MATIGSSLSKIVTRIICAVFVGALIYAGYDAYRLRQFRKYLKEEGVTCYARIYQLERGVRGQTEFHYEFEVDKKRYTSYFNGNNHLLVDVGDTLQIIYNPVDPSRSEIVKGQIRTKKVETKTIIFGIVELILVILYLCYQYRKIYTEEKRSGQDNKKD